jgi:hypothetical protein
MQRDLERQLATYQAFEKDIRNIKQKGKTLTQSSFLHQLDLALDRL